MLSRNFRLRKKEVERVFKKGQNYQNASYKLRYLKNYANHFRVAIVIPKAIIAKATERNRLKRKSAQTLQKMTIGSFDFIMTLKRKLNEEDLMREIETITSLMTKSK